MVPGEYEEYVLRKGCYEVANYFKDLFSQKRIDGKVAVMVEDYTTSFFFMPCDKFGYPKYREQRYLSFIDTHLRCFEECADPYCDISKVTQKTIIVRKPLIFQEVNFNYSPEHYIFLWEGEMVDSKEIPIGELDIKQLMKLTQSAIEKREGIIIDEVLKNKLIK